MRLIAHRGASGHAPENTMAAFRLALEMGARAVELDAHQTKDGRLVVIHDGDLRRVGRRPGRIAEMSWKELSSVDVGSWFSPRFRGERIPLLEDVMDLLDGSAELHLEIKSGSRLYPGIERRVVALLRRRRARETTLVSSFDHAALGAARALDRRLRLGYLLGSTPAGRAFEEIKGLSAESLNVSLAQARAPLAREAHHRGLNLLVYTVNRRRDLERLRSLGADGVFSNYPELAAAGER